jgi:hypothetical protein
MTRLRLMLSMVMAMGLPARTAGATPEDANTPAPAEEAAPPRDLPADDTPSALYLGSGPSSRAFWQCVPTTTGGWRAACMLNGVEVTGDHCASQPMPVCSDAWR